MMLKLAIILVIVTAVVQANPMPRKKEHNRHSELLKPETNAIDHGPNNYKSAHRLLGHKGEHWNIKHGKDKKKNKKLNKNKKKTTHSLNGSHHDSLDDIRLQDLSYISPKDQYRMKKIKKNHKKEAEKSHSEKYLKKLKLWKAKMMSKNKPSFKIHHGNKNMMP